MHTKIFEKIIIGLIGKPGSGKETVSKIISELYPGKVHHVTFSTPLQAFLRDMGYQEEEIDRSTLQLLATNLNKHFGEDTVTRGALLLIQNSSAFIDIVDGVRWKSDFDGVRSLESSFAHEGPFTKCVMVYVTADPQIRFGRLRARSQRAGEKDMSKEDFLRQENALTESFIEELGKQADFPIDNNGTLEDLKRQVNDLCEKYVRE